MLILFSQMLRKQTAPEAPGLVVVGGGRDVEPYRTQSETRLYRKNEAQLKCDVQS